MTISHTSLTSKQEKSIAALVSQPSVSKAAEVARVSEATLYRWLQIPVFKESYRLARRETLAHAVVRVQSAADRAVETLETIMTDPASPAPSRVTAARAVLEAAFKAAELEDMEERLSLLESMMRSVEAPVR